MVTLAFGGSQVAVPRGSWGVYSPAKSTRLFPQVPWENVAKHGSLTMQCSPQTLLQRNWPLYSVLAGNLSQTKDPGVLAPKTPL